MVIDEIIMTEKQGKGEGDGSLDDQRSLEVLAIDLDREGCCRLCHSANFFISSSKALWSPVWWDTFPLNNLGMEM